MNDSIQTIASAWRAVAPTEGQFGYRRAPLPWWKAILKRKRFELVPRTVFDVLLERPDVRDAMWKRVTVPRIDRLS